MERRGNKFDLRSRKVIIVGYDNESTNSRFMDPEKRPVFVSSDVTFDEAAGSISHEGERKVKLNFDPDFGNNDQLQIVALPVKPLPNDDENIGNQVDVLPAQVEAEQDVDGLRAVHAPIEALVEEVPGGGQPLALTVMQFRVIKRLTGGQP